MNDQPMVNLMSGEFSSEPMFCYKLSCPNCSRYWLRCRDGLAEIEGVWAGQAHIWLAHAEDYDDLDWTSVARKRDQVRYHDQVHRPDFHRAEMSDESAWIFASRNLSDDDGRIRFRLVSRTSAVNHIVGLFGYSVVRDHRGYPAIDDKGLPKLQRLPTDRPVVIKLSSSTPWKLSPLRLRGTGKKTRVYEGVPEYLRPIVQAEAENEVRDRFGRTFNLAVEGGVVDPPILVPEVVKIIDEITVRRRSDSEIGFDADI